MSTYVCIHVNECNRLSADCVGASKQKGFLVHLPSRVDSLGGNLVNNLVKCIEYMFGLVCNHTHGHTDWDIFLNGKNVIMHIGLA